MRFAESLIGTPSRAGTIDPVVPERVAFAAVFDATAMNPAEPFWLFKTLELHGGLARRARRILYHVGRLHPRLRQALLGMSVRLIETCPVEARIAHLNKLRMFEPIDDVDVIVGLDTDIAVLSDPMPWIGRSGLSAKPVDRVGLGLSEWTELYAHFNLDVPRSRYLTSFHAQPTPPYFNSGVIVISTRWVAELRDCWHDMAVRLLDAYEDLSPAIQAERFYTDQFALSLALRQLDLPVQALPISMNFPGHHAIHPAFEPEKIDPILFHHHHRMTDDGILPRTPYRACSIATQQHNDRVSALTVSDEARPDACTNDTRNRGL